MKRLIILLLFAASAQILSAQVITSSSLMVERKAPRFARFEHGYRGFADVGVSVDLIQPEKHFVGFDITTTHGYQFNNILFIGGGTGLLGNPAGGRITYSIPVFAAAKTYITKTRVKPYVEFRAGYNIGLGYKCIYQSNSESDQNGNHYRSQFTEYQKYRGLYFLLGLGVEYGRFSVHVDWSPRRSIINNSSLHYTNGELDSNNRYDYGYFSLELLAFCLGFNF